MAQVTISKKTAGNIGLFGAISVIVGAIIGIGIFFKNGNIFVNNNGNSIGILLSWGIAILIALATAYAFGEITVAQHKNVNTGLGGWSDTFIGPRFGRCVKIWQPFCYYAFYVVCCSVFAAEAICNCFSHEPGQIDATIKMWMVMLIAIAIMLFFTGSATFTNNVNKNFSKVTTPIKFLPIAVVIILGITFGSIYSEHNLFIHPGEIFDTNKPASGNSNFDMNGVFVSLPPILFALDSFLIVGNIASDVKNAKKNVPLSILISMILSGTVYLLTTIGQIFTGCGNVYQLIQFIFDKGQETDVISTATRVCTIIVSTFVLISILGVNNSLSMAMVFSAQAVVDEEIIIGSTTLKRWGNGHKHLAGFYATWIVCGTMILLYGIPSIILNTDQIMDGLSNLPVLGFFTVYGIVAISSAVNHFTNKVKTIRAPLQSPLAIFGGIGCIAIAAYAIIYTFTIQATINANADNHAWGLFLYNGWNGDWQNTSPEFILNWWQSALIFWSFGLIFIAAPFVNDLLIQKIHPNQNKPLVWHRQRR